MTVQEDGVKDPLHFYSTLKRIRRYQAQDYFYIGINPQICPFQHKALRSLAPSRYSPCTENHHFSNHFCLQQS